MRKFPFGFKFSLMTISLSSVFLIYFLLLVHLLPYPLERFQFLFSLFVSNSNLINEILPHSFFSVFFVVVLNVQWKHRNIYSLVISDSVYTYDWQCDEICCQLITYPAAPHLYIHSGFHTVRERKKAFTSTETIDVFSVNRIKCSFSSHLNAKNEVKKR